MVHEFHDYRFNPYAESLRGCYRKSLLRLGKSTNSPVASLSKQELSKFKALPEGRFLMHMKDYFEGLSLFERRVLTHEALERGLHYRFWYVPSVSDRDYRRMRKRICEPVYMDAKKEGLL